MEDYKTLLFNLKKILSMRVNSEQEIMDKLISITGKNYKSVWRRLRGEYKFSFDEIFNICSELGISIESLGAKNPASVSSLRVYHFPDALSFEAHGTHIEKMFSSLESAAKCKDSSFTMVCNRIPEFFHIPYDKMSQLLLLKLNYFTKPGLDKDFYRKLAQSWGLFEYYSKYYQELRDLFRTVTVVWGTNIIENFVREIRFFLDVDMITTEDVQVIKKELTDMITYINDLCEDPSPHEKFTFALSPVDMNFHSNMINSSKINRADYFLYHLAFAYTENEEDLRSQKLITDRLINAATIISGSNHKARNQFIKKQLEIIHTI